MGSARTSNKEESYGLKIAGIILDKEKRRKMETGQERIMT
jgi:hypothetical protein